MWPGKSEFTVKYSFRYLSIDELKRFIEVVEERFNVRAFGFSLKSVRPEQFKRQDHNFSVENIFDAINEYPEHVRLYDIRFCSQNIKGQALIKFISLGIRVVCRSKFGNSDENERVIELNGLNCTNGDFNYFCKACDEVLHLSPYFPPGKDKHDLLIEGFLESEFLLPEVKTLILGAVTTGQYDLAIKALSGVVESNLRDKLIDIGVTEAETKAGTELANIAYNKSTGRLMPPWPKAIESVQGCHIVFNGFFQWIRNGFHHHAEVVETNEGVLELIQLCNSLIKIIELSTIR